MDLAPNASHLYFVGAGAYTDDYVWAKIGITNNLKNRMAALRTHCPMDLDLLATVSFCSSMHSRKYEKQLHTALRNFSAPGGGEWFSFFVAKWIWHTERCVWEDDRRVTDMSDSLIVGMEGEPPFVGASQ